MIAFTLFSGGLRAIEQMRQEDRCSAVSQGTIDFDNLIGGVVQSWADEGAKERGRT